jgi:hypothetical protein
METREAAELQVLLEGVPLPARKSELITYASREDPQAARALEALPEREYSSLDEVGEALAPVQPLRREPTLRTPRAESGDPPGAGSYLEPRPEPGAIRPSAPVSQPQQVLEQQSKTQKQQQERQRQLG